MTTIDVQGRYLVAAHEDLVFEDETAFRFLDTDDRRRSVLVNAGSVSVTSSLDIAVFAGIAASATPAAFWNREGGTLSVTGSGNALVEGVELIGNQSAIRNDGNIHVDSAAGARGILTTGQQFRLANAGAIAVHASGDAVGAWLMGQSDVTNDGRIEAVSDAGIAQGLVFHAGASLLNGGRILARGELGAVALDTGFHGVEILNTGEIVASISGTGQPSAAISVPLSPYGEEVRITNEGLIRGDNAILMQANSALNLSLQNSGKIVGDVFGGSAADVILNSREIIGDIDLGFGADLYSGLYGSLDGIVYGAGWNDTLIGGRNDDVLYGDGAIVDIYDGDDHLAGARGNDRLYGGAGNDLLAGGQGNDTLVGGLGADTLQGNSGSDVFVFESAADSTNEAPDHIGYFHKTSLLDLSAIDADTTVAGDQAFYLVSAFSHGAGQLRLSLVGGETLVQGDVDGDGNADFTIVMEGRHLHMTNFVL